ncbi:MAG: LysR family transcriptional regulator [Oscillospiraceae bacterium]|nr:LysR family transcriptional regulator [Oscillospiraceae bacterium]
MNTIQMKYALEIAQTGSMTAAAQNLFLSQPNLSKTIKELEQEIGIKIFIRSTKGVKPTREGEEFLANARVIYEQIVNFDAMYTSEKSKKTNLTFCGPRATYISLAFTDFLNTLHDRKQISVNIRELSTRATIDHVAVGEAHIGVVRYIDVSENYMMTVLRERGLEFEPLLEFEPVLVMSEKHPLAIKEEITESDLGEYIELVHGDMAEERTDSHRFLRNTPTKRIYLYERGSQGDILSNVHTTYMWMSRMPENVRRAGGLVVKHCVDRKTINRDILIYRKGHIFSSDEKALISCIKQRINDIEKQTSVKQNA